VLATTAERNQEPRPAFTFAEHNLISGESIELQAESLAIAIDTWEQERSTDEAFDLWHVVDVTLANVELERPEGDTDGVSRVSVAADGVVLRLKRFAASIGLSHGYNQGPIPFRTAH